MGRKGWYGVPRMHHILGHAFNADGRIEPSEEFDYEGIYQREEGVRAVQTYENALPIRLLRWQWQDSYTPKKVQGLELRAAVVCWATLPALRSVSLTEMAHGLGRRHKQSLGRYVDDFKLHFPALRNPSMR